jgi:two-component system sensor kinase FixL
MAPITPRESPAPSQVTSLLLFALVLFAGVVWLHSQSPVVPLGVLYVFPMLVAALVLNRWQVMLFGLILATVRSAFLAADTSTEAMWRFLLGLLAYWAAGLFVVEMVRNRSLLQKHDQEISAQHALLLEAQENLKTLAESSPAAILTLDHQARVISGNAAASALIGVPPESLHGFSVQDCLPVLADALKFAPGTATFRTAAQCQGRRSDGVRFVAQTWFSTYDSPTGRRLAAIAVDISDEIREREEQNLRQLLANNRIVAAAVSHEIRNICGAIALVYSKISEDGPHGRDANLQALGSLVGGLGKIAAFDLQVRARSAMETVDLGELLDSLRIMIEPDWKEADGLLQFHLTGPLPRVFGEGYGILQVLMNLAQNSLRAVRQVEVRRLEVSVSNAPDCLRLRLADTGPGVAAPAELFEPFRSGHGQTGIGLYVSRAMLRSYGGDLKYEPSDQGAVFVLELATAAGLTKVTAP